MAFKDTAIYICGYCGEFIKSKAIYCKNCSTQAGRKKIYDENVAIAKERMKNGWTPPEGFGFKDWKPRLNSQGKVVTTTSKSNG